MIELMEPLGDDSPMAGFLEGNPCGGIHHFCIVDGEFLKILECMQSKGIRVLGQP